MDVAEEVLLRLSVKDVVRCKSVCKSWYSLISSPCFIKLHVKFICKKEDKQLGNRRIALSNRYGIRDKYPDEWECYSTLCIEGSCNGLVCMSSLKYRISLTNPSTREFRKLHKPPILPKVVTNRLLYGFGYDSSTDDYKLVFLFNQGSDGALVQILSLKSNVWKVFGHVNYSFDDSLLCVPGILFNGALHWIMYENASRDKAFLVSFDLATEEFKEIAKLDDTRFRASKLGTIQDHLCIFNQRNDIWVLNFNQSWELLPTHCVMKDRVHYMIYDSLLSKKMPSYFCCENTFLSTSRIYFSSPIFVQTLVSPYVNNHGRPKKNNTTVDKERREIEEDVEPGRKKRKRKSSKRRKKTVPRKKERLM